MDSRWFRNLESMKISAMVHGRFWRLIIYTYIYIHILIYTRVYIYIAIWFHISYIHATPWVLSKLSTLVLSESWLVDVFVILPRQWAQRMSTAVRLGRIVGTGKVVDIAHQPVTKVNTVSSWMLSHLAALRLQISMFFSAITPQRNPRRWQLQYVEMACISKSRILGCPEFVFEICSLPRALWGLAEGSPMGPISSVDCSVPQRCPL